MLKTLPAASTSPIRPHAATLASLRAAGYVATSHAILAARRESSRRAQKAVSR